MELQFFPQYLLICRQLQPSQLASGRRTSAVGFRRREISAGSKSKNPGDVVLQHEERVDLELNV